MKKHYETVAKYSSSADVARVAQSINPSQRTNASQFPGKLSKYPVSMAKVDRIATMISGNVVH